MWLFLGTKSIFSQRGREGDCARARTRVCANKRFFSSSVPFLRCHSQIHLAFSRFTHLSSYLCASAQRCSVTRYISLLVFAMTNARINGEAIHYARGLWHVRLALSLGCEMLNETRAWSRFEYSCGFDKLRARIDRTAATARAFKLSDHLGPKCQRGNARWRR